MSKNSPIIVIFGITGDLSKRKLLPALYHMFKEGLLPDDTKIIGTSRKPLEKPAFIGAVELCVLEKDNVCDPKVIEKVKNALELLQLDPNNKGDYLKLTSQFSNCDPTNSRIHLFYMSIPAAAYSPIIANLGSVKFNEGQTRLLLEKPFGYNMESAKQLIKLVNTVFNEDQIYRIDHYLAKETAQNLHAFRLHNPIFRPLWNDDHIERIHIRALETIGIEGRVNFYEQTGALRDIIQSHLMQLLSIVMMDLPPDMTSASIHKSKQQFFSKLRPADPKKSLRGQYDSYRSEVNNPTSNTETYAKVVLQHDSDTWGATELILETGKAMGEKTSDVAITFKTAHERRRNNLSFQLQPNEGISLDLMVKEPGLENNMHHTALDFRYERVFKSYSYIDAYERVLMDAINGDQSLFASDREVIETWRVLDPVLDYWQSNSDHLHFYTVGSKGLSLT